MSAMSSVYIKDLFDKRPQGQMLVVQSQKDMLVVTEFSLKQCKVRKFNGSRLDKRELLVEVPQFTGYWYMPECEELVFGRLEDPYIEKMI